MDSGAHIIRGLLDAAVGKRDAARAEMQRAERALERADIEVAAFKRALDALGGADVASPVAAQRRSAVNPGAAAQSSAFSEKWVAVFRDLFNNADEPYTYDEIVDAAQRQGSTSGTNSLRAQMMKAVDAGLFERVAAGKFRITEFGLETIGASQKENGPPKGGPEAEEATTSSNLSERGISGDPFGSNS